MRIAIDNTPLKTEHQYRGIGFYTKNLIEALKTYDKKNEYIFFTRGEKLPKVDLVHRPYFDLFFLTLPFSKKYPTVVTVFDVTPLIFQGYYSIGFRGWIKFFLQRYSLKSANKIITISQTAKEDIAKFLKEPLEKIEVIHLAASPIFQPITNHLSLATIKNKYHLPEKFILYVGDVNYNKNLKNLFRAMVKVDLPLVMVGQAAGDDNLPEVRSLLKLAQDLKISEKIIRTGFVADSDLAGIYNLAKVLVLPSLAEGFGLPVLEAIQAGCPVVCSNIPVLKEVAEDSVIFINPNSQENLASAIQKVLQFNNSQLEVLKKKGLDQAKKFSWAKTAQETIKVYAKVISDQ